MRSMTAGVLLFPSVKSTDELSDGLLAWFLVSGGIGEGARPLVGEGAASTLPS